jgi:riboflavin biosynthesis pyrimidine reductase
VDEVNLTIAPTMISGRSARIAHGPEAEPPLDMRLDRLLLGDRSLFLRYLRA